MPQRATPETPTLDATSATTLRNTAMASLSAGSGWTPVMSDYANERGEQFRLSDSQASGTTGDKIRLVYEGSVPVIDMRPDLTCLDIVDSRGTHAKSVAISR